MQWFVLSLSVRYCWITKIRLQFRQEWILDLHRIFNLHPPKDGTVQKVVPTCLHPHLSYHSHFLTLAGHQGKRRVYDSAWREYYWRHMAKEDYTTMRDCHKKRPKYAFREATTPLSTIPWERPKGARPDGHPGTRSEDAKRQPASTAHNRSLQYLTSAVPMSNMKALHIASLFQDSWLAPYRTPEHILMDKKAQFMSKFFELLCSFLGLKLLTTTAYHQQTNPEAAPFTKMIIAHLG